MVFKRDHRRILFFHFLLLVTFFVIPGSIKSQVDTTVTDTIIPVLADDERPEDKKDLEWNEMDLGFTTLRIGGGYILDFVSHTQDEEGESQSELAGIQLETGFKTRDFRFLLNGKFNMKLPVIWKLAVMYDGAGDEWLVRETGLVIGLPKLNSQLFVGRSKEGFSIPKTMNGHSPWTMERQMAIDLVPIMADGIRLYTYLPKSRVFWTLAAHNDVISKGQKFSTFASQYLVRLGYLPFYHQKEKKLLHLAGYFRYGKPLDEKFVVRSRPESNATPYFIDTGTFPTDHSTHIGGEVYYTSGPLQIGSEYYVHKFYSDVGDDHTFPGYDVSLCYMFTGESRPYNTTGNLYGFVKVDNPVGKGGWGAWEGVLRYSSFDLNDGSIQGGSMWRITPMVNWYMNKVIRVEFVYGYGVLDRFGIKGGTHFFQSRLQFTVF